MGQPMGRGLIYRLASINPILKACLRQALLFLIPAGNRQRWATGKLVDGWFMDDGYNRAKSVIIVRGITEKSPIFAKYIVFIGDGWLFADDEMNGNFTKHIDKMKHIFTLVLMALLPYVGALAEETSTATDDVRYIVMADGQVVAIPEKYILGEETVGGVCTLSLEGGEAYAYRVDEVVSISDSYDVSSAQLLSFGFTHADNDQVYADVEATIAEEGDRVIVTADVPVIGKRLRPSFTVSEGVTMWLDGVQQVSGQSSLRFEEPVVYTLALPGHWMYEVQTVEDEDTDVEVEPTDGWTRTKVDISAVTTTNAPSNHASYQDLSNLWDDSHETYYHSTWGDNLTYPKLNWVAGGYYGDGITEWPYVQVELNTTLQDFCLSYTTSNQNNRFPQGWRITARNKNTGGWDEIDVLTQEEHSLPQMNLETFTTPIYALGENYTAIRLELTKASYKNYMVIGDLSLYECVEVSKEPAEPSEPTDPELLVGFKPFGRQCQVNVKYLTDYATGDYKIPTVYITFGDGVTWDNTQWIGQTLTAEDGTTYNTKEEWITDCTFRLDGAGIWPDIDTVEGCEVRGRGNSTWSWNYRSKNPYRIKFPKKAKQSPFNLTEDRQWVLISNKQNGSMTTNAIAQKVAAMVDGEAICHMIPVDLYINGHYRGSYCFTEKIGIADNSVAIDETTGCLLELDDYYDEDFRFRDATYNLPVNVKDPDFTEEDAERIITFEEVQASVNSLTATLASGGDITQHIDMESWAKFWLVNDLVRNVETYHPKSCYMFNENPAAGGLWKFGPAWDFDWAFGYEESYSYFTTGAEEDLYSRRSGKAGYNFYNALRNTEAGKRAYYKEWMDFVAEGRVEELLEYIADYTEFASLSIAHNNDADISEKNSTNYEALVAKSQQWIESRASYIVDHLTAYEDIGSDIVTPEDYGDPLEALLIVDALHKDFAPEAGAYASFSYIRSMEEGRYGTIMLPFAPDEATLDNYAFYALAESGDDYLRFEEVAEPAANTPYLYALREGKGNVAITGDKAAVSSEVESAVVNGWEIVGSFTNQTIDTRAGNYYAFSSSRSEVNRVTQSLAVLPYRAYFKRIDTARSALRVYIGDETSVVEISGDEIEDFGHGNIYDVYGRRVMEPKKGVIYIINGKKVMF